MPKIIQVIEKTKEFLGYAVDKTDNLNYPWAVPLDEEEKHVAKALYKKYHPSYKPVVLASLKGKLPFKHALSLGMSQMNDTLSAAIGLVYILGSVVGLGLFALNLPFSASASFCIAGALGYYAWQAKERRFFNNHIEKEIYKDIENCSLLHKYMNDRFFKSGRLLERTQHLMQKFQTASQKKAAEQEELRLAKAANISLQRDIQKMNKIQIKTIKN